jgi:hypothetical protein
MIFIVHTIAAAQHGLKMCSPDAYRLPTQWGVENAGPHS